eukprot:TRINITY_DN7396_c0_g1_i3.p2 TRINITY_DN7396_c0_g1~~TRINITY_DN7396_c0_g1_i3.p2  ORF type:complete len:190 (+),score=22.67 TRINITY_DN7396_c0_g1_i3:155-724(+)
MFSLWTSQEIDKQGVQYNSDVETAGSTDGGGFGGVQLGQEQHDFWLQWFQNSIFGCAPNADGSMSEENFTCGSPDTTLTNNADRIMRAPHPKKMGAAASVADTTAYYTKPTTKSIAASSQDSQFVTLSATMQVSEIKFLRRILGQNFIIDLIYYLCEFAYGILELLEKQIGMLGIILILNYEDEGAGPG